MNFQGNSLQNNQHYMMQNQHGMNQPMGMPQQTGHPGS
jgi:hypothetical protein